MPVDDMPEPSPAPDDAGDCQADIAYQSRVDASIEDEFRLIRVALSILTADIDRGVPGTIEDAAIRDMRTATADRIKRIMISDQDQHPGDL